jgi:dCMP deaminase
MIKDKHIKLYMDLIDRISKESYAKRLQVGSLIVKDDNIISFGWNGMPPDWDNSCEDEANTTKIELLHAEENAILKLARGNESAKGATPCINCARMIYKSGINKVYYKNVYRSSAGLTFLYKCNIEIIQWPERDKIIVDILDDGNINIPHSVFIN